MMLAHIIHEPKLVKIEGTETKGVKKLTRRVFKTGADVLILVRPEGGLTLY